MSVDLFALAVLYQGTLKATTTATATKTSLKKVNSRCLKLYRASCLEDGFPSQLQGTKLKSFVQNSVGKNYEINNYVLILCYSCVLHYFSRYPLISFQGQIVPINRQNVPGNSQFVPQKCHFVPRMLYIFSRSINVI